MAPIGGNAQMLVWIAELLEQWFSTMRLLQYTTFRALMAALTAFLLAVCGAGLGFLWWNAHPASMFMGDVGSLSLGATLGAVAVILRQEIVLAIMGALFVAEALSVILQVASYKLFKVRIFKMAPIHHHFEQLGWKETTVVTRFWIVTIMMVLLGLATLKIR